MLHGILIFEPESSLATMLMEVARECSPDIIIAQVGSVYEAQQAAAGEASPEIMVLDLNTDQLALDLLIDLKTSHPLAKILLLAPSTMPTEFEQAARLSSVHFLAKPFTREQFQNMLFWLLNGPKAGGSGLFQAQLLDMLLLDLLHLKCLSGASTQLEIVTGDGEKGRLVFEKGQVIHAEAGWVQGLEAFEIMIAWKGGVIHEKPLGTSSARTIDKEYQWLLLDAARILDEKIISQGSEVEEVKVIREVSVKRIVQTQEVDDDHEEHFQALPKILVVDDSPLVLRFIEQVLGRSFPDLAVITVETGQEGLDCALEFHPELILLDYVLPDFNGDSFCSSLLSDNTLGSIPVIVMSGLHSQLQEIKGKYANVFSVLEKPFSEQNLVEEAQKGLALKNDLV
jgi:CheY-like chemotaxis protein